MAEQLDEQRAELERLLGEGLQTEWQHRAYDDAEIQSVLRRLNELPGDDHAGKLRVGGFTLTPYVGEADPEIEQSCRTCMYYEAHRRYCALPELKLPVEPDWSCVLWRI
jgi:hypothetical protein